MSVWDREGWWLDVYGGIRHDCGTMVTLFAPGLTPDEQKQSLIEQMKRHEELCELRQEGVDGAVSSG